MRTMYGSMYMRPGKLNKEFAVKTLETTNENGYPHEKYVESGFTVNGILAEADSRDSDKVKSMWDQEQHSLTHTLVLQRRYEGLKKGDLLTLRDRNFLVLTCDDVADMGKAGIIYLEERNDLA